MSEQLAPGLAGFCVPRRERETAAATRFLALVGGLLCVGAVTMVAANTPGNAAFGRALVELLIVAAPVVAGLYALRSGAE